MKQTTGFNPIKEETDGKIAKSVIWSTRALELAMRGLEQGKKLKANPFYENNIKLLKGDLVFQRTPEEIEEWQKCRNDIIYWVVNYAQLLTPEGIKKVKLRDYQEGYLKHVCESQLSIYLSCRQAGKCVDFTSIIKIKFISSCNEHAHNKLKKYYIEQDDYYELPIFELYNLYDNSFNWKLKYILYKLLYNTGNADSRRKDHIIALLAKLNTYCGDAKLIKSFMLNNIYIKTEEGWSIPGYIHQTKPLTEYEVITENNLILKCADRHKIFDENMNPVDIVDLHPNDLIQTEFGLDRVVQINKTNNALNMCDITVFNDNESYYTNNILSHNTTTSSLFLLHYSCFNIDKNALVLGNKRKTAIEILDKIKKIYLELPFFLKPGIYKWNESEIVFDNGCRIMAEATTINSGIGFTFHCVLADEFAHIPPNILESFYNNLFPTITAGKAKFLITSTQNGYNLFYRLYKAAEAGENDYKSYKTDWWEVPEWDPENKCWIKRDEEWHMRQVANYGSEEAFNKQFGTNFDISANTLINQKVIAKKQQMVYEFVNKDLLGVPNSEHYFWLPEFNPMTDLKNSYVVITTDLAEGGGGDDTVLPIARMINPGTDDLEVVGYFISNSVKREDVAISIQTMCCLYTDMNKTLLSFELNTYGELFLDRLISNIEKIPNLSTFDPNIIIKYYNEEMTRFRYGVKITPGNKKTYCMLFKEAFERNEIIFNDAKFLIQITNFSDNGNGKFAAAFGHDDIVMAVVQFMFVKNTIQYKLLRNEFNESQQSKISNEYNINDFLSQISTTNQYNNMFNMYNNYNINDESNKYARLNKFSNNG